MDTLTGFLTMIPHRWDAGDTTDRLHYQYTTLIIALFAITLFASEYVGAPIQCWFPAEFLPTWESYGESYCFIKNTYYLPWDKDVPEQYERRDKEEIGYYQWVPIILIAQGLLFYVPCLIWTALNWQSGINVKGVLWCASAVKKDVTKGTRQMMVDSAAGHLGESIGLQKDLSNVQGNFCGALFYGKLYGMWVTGLYLFVKLLYILNVVVQFLIMNAFLRTKYTFWGWGILRDILNGVQWEESGHFPRVTMCDFQVRVLGNIHRWSVQCVLMINMFNEKIYVFLWWWFLIVGLLSMLSFAYWLAVSVIPSQRVAFVEKYLRVMKCIEKKPSPAERQLVARFCSEQLRPDGVFLIRMIQTNGGDLLTGEILKSMFTFWKDPALWWADNAERFAAMEQQQDK